MNKPIDLHGKTFGSWTVFGRGEKEGCVEACWTCRCACGKIAVQAGSVLRRGKSKKCLQCFSKSRRNISFEFQNTQFFKTWAGVKQRCLNEKNPAYKHYGRRGIKTAWITFSSFHADMYLSFVKAKNEFKNQRISLERVDVNGNYCKENCIWIPITRQPWNQRPRKNSSGVTGVYKSKNRWVAKIGFQRKEIYLGLFVSKEAASLAYQEAFLKRKDGHLQEPS